MSLLNTPCLLTISGPTDTGKSTLLIGLINLFIAEPGYTVYDAITNTELKDALPLTKPRKSGKHHVASHIVYIELPCGRLCGVATAGDCHKALRSSLSKLQNFGCITIVVATRLKFHKTYIAAKHFAINNNFPFITFEKHRINKSINYGKLINIDLATPIFEMIK